MYCIGYHRNLIFFDIETFDVLHKLILSLKQDPLYIKTFSPLRDSSKFDHNIKKFLN